GRRSLLDRDDAPRAVRTLDAEAQMKYKGRDAVVLGLGLTGFSLARHLAANGAAVRVVDTRAKPPFAAKLATALPHVKVTTGPIDDAMLAGADLIAISPGVPKDQR